MLKVKLTFRNAKAVINKEGKPAIEYEEGNSEHIVASTKSLNKLLDDIKKENKVPQNVITEEIYISKEDTTKAIEDVCGKGFADKNTAKFIAEHMVKALDGACVFKRPPVIR